MTRKQFAADNALFRMACALAGLFPSRHQAKRYRAQQGLAWQHVDQAREFVAHAKDTAWHAGNRPAGSLPTKANKTMRKLGLMI